MRKSVKIYFTSDLHGYFYPTNYADKETKAMGLFQCANQFQKDENTLVIDGGDILQGSAFAYYCQKELKSNQPIAQIMNLCGYDYVTLGNHDFNYGQQYLEEYITGLNAKCVCQNVSDRNGRCLFPYDIKSMENGIRIGIVGIVTDYVNIWEKKENIQYLTIKDPFEEAKRALEELKGKVDVTICIYHGGFERNLDTGERLSTTTENIAYQICEELGFDVLLTGHQHISIEGQYVHGTYVVGSKENGLEYQIVELELEGEEVKIHATLNKAKEMDGIVTELNKSKETDGIVADVFSSMEKDVQTWLDNEVGELSEPLLPDQRIRMAREGNKIADFLNQIQLYYSKAQISAVSLANDVKGVEKKVTRRDIIATYPYPNILLVCEITGEDLRNAVERSAEYFELNERGEIEVSNKFLKPKIEHYNYDYYAGIRYKIDPSKPVKERVIFMQYQHSEIMKAEVYTICINNYRGSGAGGYNMYPKCKRVKVINIEMVELILDYFEMHKNELIEIPQREPICV